jgi:hypothetical protein
MIGLSVSPCFQREPRLTPPFHAAISEISGSIKTAAQLSAQPMRYDWQPPAEKRSKITLVV